jgi:uncharacterized protein YndB with AHSA1/START domain
MPSRTPLLLLALLSLPALGEVRASAPAMLQLEDGVEIAAPPAKVYRALSQIDRWWSSQHTFSGSAHNLHLQLEEGGTWSETWKGGGVEHGRVIRWAKDSILVLDAPLGPLQSMAVRAVLTFALAPSAKGTRLTLTYRVSGDPSHGLDKLAPAVDRVLSQQLERLRSYVQTGHTPPEPAETKTPKPGK